MLAYIESTGDHDKTWRLAINLKELQTQVLNAGQEVFNINPGNEAFFGQMSIPQDNMGKVKEGQEVLAKLKSYPFEEYGMIRGKISHIADVPYKDSVFVSKADFKVRSASDEKTDPP